MDDNNLENAVDKAAEGQSDPTLLSDVIEVIATDPDFGESAAKQQPKKMFNGGGEILQLPQQQQQTAASPHQQHQARRQNAYVRIVEQPAPKALRFRYECEGRSAGSIPGASSTPDNKTFPSIQVVGYQGRAMVVVSCVTKDPPYRPHPHNLVGREGCKKGVCMLEIPSETMTVNFPNLGIQCVKKKDIVNALRVREEIRVDPFRTGFSHRDQPTSIDLNSVRLCFQVFLEGSPGNFKVPLEPVVSEPIYDKKAMSDLSIVRLSDCNSYVDGGRKDIILLCEKVAKEDIQVRFYEKNGDWEAYADFQPSQVHKQTAIWFRPPRYKTLEVTEPVKVCIQLRRPSDGATSEPVDFELLPLDSDPSDKKRKRQKLDNPEQIIRHLQGQDRQGQFPTGYFIKSEPRDTTPSPYQGGLSPYGGGISPASAASGIQYNIAIGSTPSPDPLQYTKPSPQYPGNSPQPEYHTGGGTLNIIGGQWQATISTEVQQTNWNIPMASTSAAASAQNVFFDLDSGEVNSEEIASYLPTDSDKPLPVIQNITFSSEQDNLMESVNRLENISLENQFQSPS